MTEPVSRPPLVYLFQRRQTVKVRAPGLEEATELAEVSEDWSAGEISLIDVVEEQP